MNVWKSAADYARREPWTVLMFAAVAAAIAWSSYIDAHQAPPTSTTAIQSQDAPAEPSSLTEKDSSSPPPDVHSEAERIKTAQKMEALEARILKDPKLQAKVGVGVLLLLVLTAAGLVWCVLLMHSLRRGERWMDRFGSPRIAWGMNEAFKAVVLMFFLDLTLSALFSYVFSLFGNAGANMAVMTAVLVRSVLILIYLGWKAAGWGIGWSDLGLCGKRPGKQIFWGLAGYLAMIPVYLLSLACLVLVLKVLKMEPAVQTPVQILYTESNATAVFAFSFFMGVLGPWFEEILFRGFVYPAFRQRLGINRGILASSVLFAALHGHGVAFVPILVLGITLHLLYQRSGSIVPGAVLHMTHNSAMLTLTLVIRQLTS